MPRWDGKIGNVTWWRPRTRAYLIVVHLELPDDLDGDFITGLSISCFVDIAESAVAHFFRQNVSFETRVSGHLPGLFSLLGDDGLNIGLDLLVLARGMCGGPAGLSCDMSIVDGGGGIFAGLRLDLVLWLAVLPRRFTDAVLISLLLSMDGRDVCGGLVARRVSGSGLLAMTYEIFQILDGAHFSNARRQLKGVGR